MIHSEKTETILVFGIVWGNPRIIEKEDGTRVWTGTVVPEGTEQQIDLRATGNTASYLIQRDPVDGDRMFGVGIVKTDENGWYVALEACATDTSLDMAFADPEWDK